MAGAPAQVDARRARLEGALEDVEGWLHLDEAWALHEHVRRALPASRPATVVEIGSFKGRSTITLGLAVAATGRGGTVYAIDPHATDEGDTEAWRTDRMPDLVANVERAGVADLVEPVRAYSHEARPRFQDGTIDALFVDGSHDYEDVLQDIDDWTSALARPAAIVFNDPNWAGVNRALRERAAIRGTAFRHPRYVYNSVFFDYDPDAPWRPRDTWRTMRLRAFLGAISLVVRSHASATYRNWRRLLPAIEGAGWVLARLLPRVR